MRSALLLLLAVLSVALVGAQDPLAVRNAPYGLPTADCADCQLVVRARYVLLHDPQLQTARWVSYVLAPEDIGEAVERSDDFREDPLVVGERGELDDYRNTGYDRGHLCPAADATRTPEDMSSTFYLSNMIPQRPRLNRGQWARLEGQVRKWTPPGGKLLIVTGPGFDADPDTERREIGDGVDVPDFCWKIVARPGATYADLQVAAFMLPNADEVPDFLQGLTTVDAVEAATGLDLLPEIPDEIEAAVEARLVDVTTWSGGIVAAATMAPMATPKPVYRDTGPAPQYRTGTGQTGGSRATGGTQANDPTVYLTDTGDKYHRSGCQHLRQSKHATKLSSARRAGKTACSVCDPL